MIASIKKLLKLKSDQFYSDLVITTAGQILVMLVTFAINKVISNQYSIAEFGTYNLIKRAASVVSFVMLMAMGIAIPKYIAEAHAKKDSNGLESYMFSGLTIIFFSFITLSLLLVLFKKSFASLMFDNQAEAINYVIPICLFSFGTAITTYAYSFYRGVDDFVRYNVICFMTQAGMLLIAIVGPHNLKWLYYVWSTFLILYGILEILLIFWKQRFSCHGIRWKFYTLQTMLEYSIPRVPGEFVLFAYNLVPLIVIQHRFGPENVAFFSAALAINTLVSPMFSMVGTILLPFASRCLINNEKDTMRSKIKQLGLIYLAVSVAAILVVYVAGDWILKLLYNGNYAQCVPIVRITIIAILPNAFYLLLRNPLDGVSKFPYNTICLICSFIVYIVLLLFADSMEFCAVSLIIAYTILGGLALLFWKKAINC